MSWKMLSEPNGNWVELVVEGEVMDSELKASTDASLEQVKARGCSNVLIDCRDVKVPPPATAIQKLPDYYDTIGVPADIRIAMVLSGRPSGAELASYYRMSAKMKHYNVQLFETYEDAARWLES
ncbi:MAG: hypothetical protein R3217_06615 [Gammaproteobacteria bacterium]|nr:hypothetical protein [Gammaproteobacteria bacterium]